MQPHSPGRWRQHEFDTAVGGEGGVVQARLAQQDADRLLRPAGKGDDDDPCTTRSGGQPPGSSARADHHRTGGPLVRYGRPDGHPHRAGQHDEDDVATPHEVPACSAARGEVRHGGAGREVGSAGLHGRHAAPARWWRAGWASVGAPQATDVRLLDEAAAGGDALPEALGLAVLAALAVQRASTGLSGGPDVADRALTLASDDCVARARATVAAFVGSWTPAHAASRTALARRIEICDLFGFAPFRERAERLLAAL